MERTTGYYNTFIVKIWSAEGITRGHIQHVGTKRYTYFLSLEKMIDFIQSRLGPPVNDSGVLDKVQSCLPLVSEDLGDISLDE